MREIKRVTIKYLSGLVIILFLAAFIYTASYCIRDDVFSSSGSFRIDQQFNYLESMIWFSFAVISGIIAIRKNNINWTALAYTFGPFGISDLIEVNTGSWWQPWQLLLLKAACIISIAYFGYLLYKENKTDNIMPQDTANDPPLNSNNEIKDQSE